MAGHDSSNIYKFFLLLTLLVCFTWTIFTRYLIIFFYSVPVGADETEKYKKWISIKEAFGITAGQFGWLTGLAFMASFCVFNLASGYIADNWNRKWVMVCGLLINCVSIALIHYAQSFIHLVALRALLALGQSTLAPICYSIINAYFTTNKTLASSIYASGVYIGYGLSTLSLLALPEWGWRNCALYAGGLGIALVSFYIIVVIEPPRAQTTKIAEQKPVKDFEEQSIEHQILPLQQQTSLSWLETMKIVFSSTHMWGVICILTLRFAVGSVLGAFWPVLAKQRFASQKDEFATINCIVVAVSGVISGLFGGFITDRWVGYTKRKREAERQNLLLVNGQQDSEGNEEAVAETPPLRPYLMIAGLSCLASVGAFFAVFSMNNLYGAMACLFFAYVVSECWLGPILTFIHSTPQLPANARSTALATVIGLSQFMAAFASVFVGYADDHWKNLEKELIASILPLGFLAGLACMTTAYLIKC